MSCYHAVGLRGPEGVKTKFTGKGKVTKQKSERSIHISFLALAVMTN